MVVGGLASRWGRSYGSIARRPSGPHDPSPRFSRQANASASPAVPRLYTSQSEFLQAAQKAVAGAGARQPVATIVAELDEFDRLADAYGAPLARRIADRTVQLARCALRRGDMLIKVSESRILLVLPTATEGAAGVAERFCSA